MIWPESYHHYHLSFITFVSCCWPRVILGFFQGWKTQSCERSFEEDLHPFATNGSFCGTGDFFGPCWYVAGLKVFSFQPQNGDVSSVLWRNFNLKFWFRHAKDEYFVRDQVSLWLSAVNFFNLVLECLSSGLPGRYWLRSRISKGGTGQARRTEIWEESTGKGLDGKPLKWYPAL